MGSKCEANSSELSIEDSALPPIERRCVEKDTVSGPMETGLCHWTEYNTEDIMITPKDHINFKALKLASAIDDEILDCAIAFIEAKGGGPVPDHTHDHDHLFTVISGEIEIHMEGKKIPLKEGMALRVPGRTVHSVWNVSNKLAKVSGISLTRLPVASS
jgi:quercetin dioxygenase-like cupin family protein